MKGSTTTKGHGRIETFTLTTSSQLNDYLDWPFLQQVHKLERWISIQKTGKSRHEIVYGVTSLSLDEGSPGELLTMLRTYWQIENSLHYRRDVTLHEDETRFTQNSTAHIMSIINNIVVGLITKAGYKFAPAARRFFVAHWRLLSVSYFNFGKALIFRQLAQKWSVIGSLIYCMKG